jgi:hypothetical protein
MPDLSEGFTSDGVAADNYDTFESGLAAAAAQARESDSSGGTSVPQPPADPATSTADEIASALLDSKTNPTIADGLTTPEEPGPPAPTEVRLGDGEVYGATEIDRAIERAAQNEQELQEHRADAIADQFAIDTENAERDSDFVEALGEAAIQYVAGELDPEGYADLREQTLEELAPVLLEDDAYGNYDESQLEHLGKALDSSVARYAMQRRDEELAAIQPELIERAATQRVAEWQAVLTDFAKGNGIQDKAELERQKLAAERAFAVKHGVSLGEVWSLPEATPKAMKESLAESHAVAKVAETAARERAFHEQLLNADSGTLSEGLTYLGVPAHQPVLPAPDPAKLSRRVDQEKARAALSQDSIAASFNAPEFKSGWTVGGKPVRRISEIDGSQAEFDRSEQWRREQARGF